MDDSKVGFSLFLFILRCEKSYLYKYFKNNFISERLVSKPAQSTLFEK